MYHICRKKSRQNRNIFSFSRLFGIVTKKAKTALCDLHKIKYACTRFNNNVAFHLRLRGTQMLNKPYADSPLWIHNIIAPRNRFRLPHHAVFRLFRALLFGFPMHCFFDFNALFFGFLMHCCFDFYMLLFLFFKHCFYDFSVLRFPCG